MVFASGCRWLSIAGGCEPVALEALLDAPGGDGADPVVDRECLLQVHRGMARAPLVVDW